MHALFKFCKDQGYKKLHLVGLNDGACLAIEWGYAHPERVASMTLLDPPFQRSSTLKKEIKTLIADLGNKDHKELIDELVYSLLPHSCPQEQKVAEKAFLALEPSFHQKVYEGLLAWDETSQNKLLSFKGPPSLSYRTNIYVPMRALKQFHLIMEKLESSLFQRAG